MVVVVGMDEAKDNSTKPGIHLLVKFFVVVCFVCGPGV
jgi:hypothetical protein